MNLNSSCQLKVPPADFKEAFRLLRKLCKPKRGEEAVLSFDGACLHVECAGMTVAPAAQGNWPHQVRIPADFILMLAKVPPAGDPIEFCVREGRLHIGSSSIACSSQSAWTKAIELPMNASFGQIFALHFMHAPEEIEAAGYAKMVQEAKSRADRQIEKAAGAIKELLVEPEELRQFVYSTMQRKIVEGITPK